MQRTKSETNSLRTPRIAPAISNAISNTISFLKRAENGALDPWLLNLRCWGAPIFSPETPKPYFEGFRSDSGRRSNDHGSNAPNSRPSDFLTTRIHKRGHAEKLPWRRFPAPIKEIDAFPLN